MEASARSPSKVRKAFALGALLVLASPFLAPTGAGATPTAHPWAQARTFTSTGPVVAALPLAGAPEGAVALVRVDAVSAVTPDGRALWDRPIETFYQDVNRTLATGGFAPLWPSAGSPTLSIEAGRPYAVGDLNGDGVDDVAVAHLLADQVNAARNALVSVPVVTVLDGSTGATLWAQEFAGTVRFLAIQDGSLVVAQQSGPTQGWPVTGAPGTTDELVAFQGLSSTPSWTLAFPAWATWLSLSPAGPGRLAVAWTTDSGASLQSGTPAQAGSTLRVLDAASGATLWSDALAKTYPRAIQYDAARGSIVAMEDHVVGSSLGPSHDAFVDAFRADDGAQTLHVVATGMIPTDLAVGDLDGDGLPEYVLSEVTFSTQSVDTPFGSVGIALGSRNPVVAYDGTTGGARWSQVAGSSPSASATERVAIARTPSGAVVVAGGFDAFWQSEVAGLDGATGALLWRNAGASDVVYPYYFATTTLAGQPVAVGADQTQNLRYLRVEDGSLAAEAPLLGQLYAVAAGDVDGDGVTDLVAGGESSGVFAIDGASVGGPAKVFWTARTGGQVHDVHVADLRGDGHLEVVVASALTRGEQHAPGAFLAGSDTEFVDAQVQAFDLATGATLWSRDFPSQYAWNVTVGDVNGDGVQDVVVPTRQITALDGATGQPLWTFNPIDSVGAVSNAVIAPGGVVLAQFEAQIPALPWSVRHAVTGAELANEYQQTGDVEIALEGATGAIKWAQPVELGTGAPVLYKGVAAGTHLAWDAGDAVAFSYEVSGAEDSILTPVTEVRDAQTGALLQTTATKAASQPFQGELVETPSIDGFVAYNPFGSYGRPVSQTPHADFLTGTTSDMVEANLGPTLGPVLVQTDWYGNGCHGVSLPALLGGTQTFSVGGGHASPTGRVVATDLDRDGVDEIVSVENDAFAFLNVDNGMQGDFGYGYYLAGDTGGLDVMKAT